MKHYDILLVTIEKIDLTNLKNINYLYLNEAEITKLNLYEDKNYSFSWDYLITDNENILSRFDLMKENGYYITNCFFQSSIDEIYIVGKINHSNYDIDYQISIIVDCLLEN